MLWVIKESQGGTWTLGNTLWEGEASSPGRYLPHFCYGTLENTSVLYTVNQKQVPEHLLTMNSLRRGGRVKSGKLPAGSPRLSQTKGEPVYGCLTLVCRTLLEPPLRSEGARGALRLHWIKLEAMLPRLQFTARTRRSEMSPPAVYVRRHHHEIRGDHVTKLGTKYIIKRSNKAAIGSQGAIHLSSKQLGNLPVTGKASQEGQSL